MEPPSHKKTAGTLMIGRPPVEKDVSNGRAEGDREQCWSFVICVCPRKSKTKNRIVGNVTRSDNIDSH